MNFQQLRIIKETVRHNFNLTEAAATLFTSPSGVSKHIKDLEQELGIVLFERRGKRLLGLTEPGRELVTIVERILADAGNINRLAQQFATRDEGHLTVATTHTQARYNLPPIVTRFKATFPNVRLVLRQSSPAGIAALVRDGDADIGIATEAVDKEPELATLAYYKWKHTLIVPAGHPLEGTASPSLADIAAWPIVTYQEGFSGRGKIDQAFAEAGTIPDIVLSAFDADVIKAHVEVGLGVGIVSSMAFDPARDAGLRRIDVDGLFDENVAKIAVRRGTLLRDFALKFIELCNPALTPNIVRAAALADAEPGS
ncbi:CysB family HTH-type transcriptional regulator [Microbacteriaceae bacterium K1510]|nr:CysB family HTH-type transcriptional regulator [Microbacteriaceae bacterium K1510]